MTIPFNKPVWLGTEAQRIRQAIESNGHIAGGGPFGERCEAWLARKLGRPTLLVTSCTHALEMAGILLDLQPGDEFIVPSFTFVSTANAFALRGARPVFADVDADGNIDPREVERLRSSRTKAVVVVHYAGGSCDMDALQAAADGVPIIEDAAQAIGSTFHGRPLGTFGRLGALSFHETKNVGCGEGGALILGDQTLQERAEYVRDKGTNRRRFLRGMVDKYSWVDIGSSYVLSDLNAAYLSAQLEQFDRIQARRAEIHERYRRALTAPALRSGGYVVSDRPGVSGNSHLFAIVLRDGETRGRFIDHMRGHGVTTPFHYVALHESIHGRRSHDGRRLPTTERLSNCLVRMPLYFNMTDRDQDEVIGRTLEFLDGP